ncbi:hypothetical protein ABI59_10960 [Acidobacteria bacterium Mor1]|nr:hypothetical protein ABI59_10960 [Acidobacteria bacterium Mor1]
MSIRRIILVLLLAGAPAWAAPAPPAPSAEQLIDRMLQALGGREAIEQVDSISIEANCAGPGGRFRTWIDSIRHDRTRFRQVSEREETEIYRVGDVVWTMDENGVAARRPSEGTAAFVAGHEFHLLFFEIERRFRDFSVGGLRETREGSCRDLNMVDTAGQPASVCLAEDGMPLELVLNPEGAEGSVRVRFGDWVMLDGVRVFWSLRLDEGESRHFRYTYAGIWINELPMTSLFVPPEFDESVEVPVHRGVHHVDMKGLTPPQAVPFHEGPLFPESAKAAGVGASVLLQFVVRAGGAVERVEMLRCVPRPLAAGASAGAPDGGFDVAAMSERFCPGFVESAAEAVARWGYRPGSLGGKPVDVWFNAEVEFR